MKPTEILSRITVITGASIIFFGALNKSTAISLFGIFVFGIGIVWMSFIDKGIGDEVKL